MLHKPDLEPALERMRAFWAHDAVGRCGLQVVARSESYRPVDESGVDLLTRRTDIGYILERAERRFRNLLYLAESLPIYTPGLVCSDTAAFFCDEIGLREDTVWYPRTIDDWDTFELAFDPANRWWQLVRSMTEAASAWAVDRCFVAIPDLQPGWDTLSLLRAPERICLDLVDNPEPARRAADYIIDRVYRYCYEEVRSIIARHGGMAGDWMGLVHPRRHDIVQCDFIALISPRFFEEFCLPSIQSQCRMLDASIFHLDGPGAIPHLDALLQIKELGAVQWVPGAGRAPAKSWLPLLKKVQQAGKSLYIHSTPDDVEELVQELSPRGLMIGVEETFASAAAAESLIRRVERACRRRGGGR